MVYNEIKNRITFEIDITEMLNEVEIVTIKIIKNNKTIRINNYKRRNYAKKRRTYEN